MTTATTIIDVFLCHTAANKEWVRMLAGRLEQEQVDGRPLRVFFDEWDVAPGENILLRIEEGLRQARFVAVVLSPALTRASWPTLEWQSQVYDDPHGKKGRIIPLLVEKFDSVTLEPLDIPFALRLLRYLDFSRSERFERELEELLRRVHGDRPSRGPRSLGEAAGVLNIAAGPETADAVEEVLLGNIFPVKELPEFVYGDETSARSYADVWKTMTGPLRVPFILHERRLYSFVPPDAEANPFRPLLTGDSPKSERTREWLAEKEHAKHLAWLFNDALSERCYALRIRTPKGDRKQFFPPVLDGKPRMFSWGRGRPITLAKVSNTGLKPLGVHRSARMRSIEIGGKLHLLVEPGYFFTSDGITPLEGRQVGILSVKWGGREGNNPVLRQTMMWVRLIAAGNTSIVLPVGGGASITVAPVPVHARLNLGVADDAGNLDKLLAGEEAQEVSVDLDEVDELDAVALAHERGDIEGDEASVATEDVLSDPLGLDDERDELLDAPTSGTNS